MITVFRTSDTLRCMVVGGPVTPNMAAPTELIIRCRPLSNSAFWAQSLGQTINRVTVGDWNGFKLNSLASARIRSGVRSWEIDRLHLADLNQASEILEPAVYSAGLRGAERVFLRVPYNSELTNQARKVGFFPYFNEIHLVGKGARINTKVNDFSVGNRTPADQQGLFQLYCAATPNEVRQGIGMTLDQWQDSQESAQVHRNESVLKSEGRILGWQKFESFGKATAAQTLGHPGYPDVTRYMLGVSNQSQNWLLPDYQPHVAELLEQKGLQEHGRYTMLIKTVSVPVKSREFSYVEA